jgi:hypothetical protein
VSPSKEVISTGAPRRSRNPTGLDSYLDCLSQFKRIDGIYPNFFQRGAIINPTLKHRMPQSPVGCPVLESYPAENLVSASHDLCEELPAAADDSVGIGHTGITDPTEEIAQALPALVERLAQQRLSLLEEQVEGEVVDRCLWAVRLSLWAGLRWCPSEQSQEVGPAALQHHQFAIDHGPGRYAPKDFELRIARGVVTAAVASMGRRIVLMP